MNDLNIFDPNQPALSVAVLGEAIARRNAVLDSSVQIGQVATAEENESAVAVQAALNALIKDVEKERKQIKEPALEFGRQVDQAAHKFSEKMIDELTRIAKLVGDFAALEQARVKAVEAANNENLNQIERERQAALAVATSHYAMDAINEQFDRKIAALPISEPARAQGQVIKNSWKIEVVDIHLLAKCHPRCVNMTPRLNDIKELLDLDVEVKGVRAEKITVAGVRASGNKMIEV